MVCVQCREEIKTYPCPYCGKDVMGTLADLLPPKENFLKKRRREKGVVHEKVAAILARDRR